MNIKLIIEIKMKNNFNLNNYLMKLNKLILKKIYKIYYMIQLMKIKMKDKIL